MGRSVLMLGDHAEPIPGGARNLSDPGKPWHLPFDLPSNCLSPFVLKCLNHAYYLSRKEGESRVPLHSFFYPLDALGNWNRLYGKQGFLQYQAVFPDPVAEVGVRAALAFLSEKGWGSFLAVLKRCGDDHSGLSFCRRGYTLALDMPLHNPSLPRLLDELDDLVLRYGGRVYLAKDARLSEQRFKAMYPEWRDFIASVRHFDPKGLCQGALAARLGLGA